MRNILVTGAGGQVGFELCKTLAPFGNVVGVDVADCDLTKPQQIEQLIQRVKPAIIVNPAAYTAVDKAESEPHVAHALNTDAPTIFAREAKRCGALFFHYSTDYVFDGTGEKPWLETDATHPLSVYGSTKRDGETGVLAENGASFIFRLEWIYGLRGVNFLLRILQLAHERAELKIVCDQFGAPTWSRSVARATAQVLEKCLLAENSWEFARQRAGIYHMAAQGRTSWFDFAKLFLDLDPCRAKQTVKSVLPIPASAYPTPAKRPCNSVLNCDKLFETFGVRLEPWEEQLRMVMTEMEAAKCKPT